MPDDVPAQGGLVRRSRPVTSTFGVGLPMRPAEPSRSMRRWSSVLLMVAAGLSTAGCAGDPPGARPGAAHPSAPPQAAPRPATTAAAGGPTLSAAEATAEVAYYRERSVALAAGTSTELARTDFVRLRRGRLYLTEGLPDREISDLRRRLTDAFGAGNGPAILDLTAQLLGRNEADIRAHMLRAISARQAGDESEARTHHDLAIALLESIMQGGDGQGIASAWTVYNVSEEYEVLKAKGCVPGA